MEIDMINRETDVMLKASLNYISKYMTVDDTIIKKIKTHCRMYNVKPDICAWYKDLDDFFSDWCNPNIGYSKMEARRLYNGGIGEFQTFPNGNIIRYNI